MGKFDEARRQFQSYTSREPKGKYARAAMFRSGEAAYLAGDFETAKPDLVRFLAKYPGDRLNAFVLPYLGDIALAGGDAAAAVGYFRDGLKQFPEGRLQDDCRIGLATGVGEAEPDGRGRTALCGRGGQGRQPLGRRCPIPSRRLAIQRRQIRAGDRQFLGLRGAIGRKPLAAQRAARPRSGLVETQAAAEAIKQFDAVLAAKSSGEELSEQALRGKIQAALDMKDYAAVDREAAEFEKQFPKSPIADDVQRMLARSLVERKQYAGPSPCWSP